MRRAQPYVSHGPDVSGRARLPVGDTPTRLTARHFHEDSFVGLYTFGNKAAEIPVGHPYAGNGARFSAFPKVLPSDAAPDMIVVPILVAINDFSPISHRNPLTTVTPPRAINPRPRQPKPNLRKRGTGGNYVIPAPRVDMQWPTSSEWLASRMVR